MTWLFFSFPIVGLIVGTIVVLTLRGKHLSRTFAVLVLLLSTLGAGAVQYLLHRGTQTTLRLSGAHLVGVTSRRIQEDSDFIRTYLTGSANQPVGNDGIDWIGTFKEKSADISATVVSVEQNEYIRNNYSVWVGDLSFRRDQMERIADNALRATEGKQLKTKIDAYLDCIELTAKLLDGLASEMRKRQPKAYYIDN